MNRITVDFLPTELKNGCDYVVKKGVYHFYDRNLTERFYFVSNNDCGNKKIRFFAKDKRNVSLDFSGSTLIFHGRISPFFFDNSSNIVVKNVKIEYDKPFYTAGNVIKHSDEKIELLINRGVFPYKVENGEFIALGENREQNLSSGINLFLEYDKRVKRPAANSFLYLPIIGENVTYDENAPLKQSHWRAEEKGGKLFFYGDFSKIIGDDRFVLTHEKRDNNVFTFINCKNVTLENVAITDGGSMGALFQNCKNVTVKKMRVKARKGGDYLVSTNCDATHFCNCRGNVSIENSVFENMMDDACNVHGIYLKVDEIIDKNTLLLKLRHFQQFGVNNFQKGDIVEISSPDMREFSAKYTVKNAVLTEKNTIKLEVEEDISGVEKGFVADNLTAHPNVRISGCKTGNNRPRGFLINTNKKAVVENCVLYNSDCGVEIAGDNSFWCESTGVRNVTIKNNVFKNCGYYGAGYCVVIHADITANPTIPDFHRNIKIVGNDFTYVKGCLYATNCADLSFGKNKKEKSKAFRFK